MNPDYLAVFDKNHELVDVEVKVPAKVSLIQAAMPDGRILASKNKMLFEDEEDFEVFYLLELVEEDMD